MKKELFTVLVNDVSANEVLEQVLDDLLSGEKQYYIVTPNPEIIVYASSHPEYTRILNNAQYSLCDGIGLLLASIILKRRIRERITGVAFLERLCQVASRNNLVVGFLGGRNNVGSKTAALMRKQYSNLSVGYVSEEWKPDDNKKKIDILFVAFGAPKQEVWMHRNLKKTRVRIMMGVGGAFDEISGVVSRAPAWIDRVGLKWLWRLIQQPWRWKRQRALLIFLGMVFSELLKHRDTK